MINNSTHTNINKLLRQLSGCCNCIFICIVSVYRSRAWSRWPRSAACTSVPVARPFKMAQTPTLVTDFIFRATFLGCVARPQAPVTLFTGCRGGFCTASKSLPDVSSGRLSTRASFTLLLLQLPPIRRWTSLLGFICAADHVRQPGSWS